MGKSHFFDVDIATKYGVNAAIILNNLRFWIDHNKANGKHFHEGRFWTYNTVAAFEELFPYMGRKQIANALKKLEEAGLILTGNYNQIAYDRTKWYALTDAAEALLNHAASQDAVSAPSIVPKGEMENAEKENGFNQKGKSKGQKGATYTRYNTYELPESKPDNTTHQVAALWAIYPKKQGGTPEKQKASKALRAAIEAGDKLEDITDGIKRYAAYCKASGIETRYIKRLSAFISGGLYLDEYESPKGREDLAAVLTQGQGSNVPFTDQERAEAEELQARLREKYRKKA